MTNTTSRNCISSRWCWPSSTQYDVFSVLDFFSRWTSVLRLHPESPILSMWTGNASLNYEKILSTNEFLSQERRHLCTTIRNARNLVENWLEKAYSKDVPNTPCHVKGDCSPHIRHAHNDSMWLSVSCPAICRAKGKSTQWASKSTIDGVSVTKSPGALRNRQNDTTLLQQDSTSTGKSNTKSYK